MPPVQSATGRSFIEPSSLWQNPFKERRAAASLSRLAVAEPVQSATGRSFIEPARCGRTRSKRDRPHFIEPSSLWQNPFVESFCSHVRDKVPSVEAFDSVLEVQAVITDLITI